MSHLNSMSNSSSTYSNKPLKATHISTTKSQLSEKSIDVDSAVDRVKLQFVEAMENNHIDLDSSEVSDYELDAV